MTKSIRADNPELWRGIVATARSIVGGWTEDEIASVMSKVVAKDADDLLDHIAMVFMWCASAQKSNDAEAVATVDLWKTLPHGVLEISVDADGGITHRINPDCDIQIVQ